MFWFHGKRDRRSEYGESVCRYGVCLNGFEVTEWCFFYAVYSWFRFFRRNKSVVVTMLKVGERVLWVQQGWCLKIRLEWVPVFLKEDFGFVIAVGCSEEGDTEDDKTMICTNYSRFCRTWLLSFIFPCHLMIPKLVVKRGVSSGLGNCGK